jgi:GH15 family glucan-1,4-alpha-glucosidase
VNDLLQLAVNAHGGLRRWEQISRFRAAASITGAIWDLKGKPGLLGNVALEGETRARRRPRGPLSHRVPGVRRDHGPHPLGEMDPVTRRFLAAAADTAADRWREKDQGIWEIRGAPRDFLDSQLMCWVALDRAIALADHLGAEDRVTDWAAARDEIRTAILEHGWNEQAQAFTQAFGSGDLDASNLMLSITGFLPGDDPRMKATIHAIADRLTDERRLVYRYRSQDGLAGEEGTFLLCTFWLAQAQALAGEIEAATATFERAVTAINDVGLLAEEVDPRSGEMIGNFPQAFSHIGLINAAWAITQAQQRTGRT